MWNKGSKNEERDQKICTRSYLIFFKIVVSVKDVVEVMDKKTTRNWICKTNLFCSILADPVTKLMLTLEQKALKKAATKEVFEAILEELKTAFMEKPFKSLNEKSLIGKESLSLDIKNSKGNIII